MEKLLLTGSERSVQELAVVRQELEEEVAEAGKEAAGEIEGDAVGTLVVGGLLLKL